MEFDVHFTPVSLQLLERGAACGGPLSRERYEGLFTALPAPPTGKPSAPLASSPSAAVIAWPSSSSSSSSVAA
ncbi:hypothetical protein EYF80_039391 [Liparis tanakae]|uniref:Uncharacterized protein n=1 Tax=Liparis tanakae TaxID=230148 RepID=A0A4Z2GCH7_9TELE|nr:hypothetical protein EYF80_039391 [Liparis tanakae]